MKTLYFAEILIMGRWDDGVLVQILKLQQSRYQLVRFFSINFAWDLYCWSILSTTPLWASAVKWVQNHTGSIKQEIPKSQNFTTAFQCCPSHTPWAFGEGGHWRVKLQIGLCHSTWKDSKNQIKQSPCEFMQSHLNTATTPCSRMTR